MNPKFKEAVRSFLPTRLRAHRIRGGPLAGRSIFTSWHDYPGAIRGDTEGPLLAWFARHVQPGQTWLDVGAHYGYTALALTNLVGEAGRVLAFEPVVATAGCIARTRELNEAVQLQVVPLGLAADPGIHPCRLPVYRGMADSTLVHAKWHELIFVSSFDWLWESLAGQNQAIHGIKIDVQGMEQAVLDGMAATLTRWHPEVVIEFHAGVDRHSIIQLLAACGYRADPEGVEPGPRQIEDNKSYAFYAK